jgi:Holliday junction resolvase RusA-like endonuclease
MAIERWYTLAGINPEPWAIGPLSVIQRGAKRWPVVGPNLQLQTYQSAVRQAIQNQGVPKIVDVECQLTFYFWRRLDRYVAPNERRHARHVADATNMQKGLEDALQGVLLTNDRLVSVISSRIVEQTTETSPGIIICLRTPCDNMLPGDIPTEVILKFDAERRRSDNFDLSDNVIS